MEYVVIAVVVGVLALVGALAFVVPRLRRRPPAPPERAPQRPAQLPTTEAPTQGTQAPPTVEVPPVPAELEEPEPTAGRLVRLRARLSRSQNVLGRGLLALLAREHLDDDAWDE
ncbi:MAG: signal recognition particle-docking protein FtsY, partial [Micromonosporaceae bacterium]